LKRERRESGRLQVPAVPVVAWARLADCYLQPPRSFGDPNAQPPTPKQTPTSAVFPSSVFETPKNSTGRFEESGNWTPRFAEEYSVFNATPGNLRGTQGPFPDFGPGPATPSTATSATFPASSQTSQTSQTSSQKRPLSAEGIAVEIATHVNHFSPNPSLPLPPVEPARRLQSSPGPLAKQNQTQSGDRSSPVEQSLDSLDRSSKKVRRGTVSQGQDQGQTATPPPSAHKGAPKLDISAMQNDQGFGQPDFMGGSQQQPGMGNFVTTPSDMFSYPLSAPATAPDYGSQRSYWDPDPSLGAMDIDFSAANANMFQPQPGGQRTMDSVAWDRTNQSFQGGVMTEHSQERLSAGVSQAAMHSLVTSSAEQSIFSATFPAGVDDPFGMAANGVGVDPGLLFSRPPSSSMEMSSFSTSMQTTSIPALAPSQENASVVGGPPSSKGSARNDIRRSSSVKEIAPRKQDRALASSPIKSTSRPGLSRSFSENRGKKPAGRPLLPILAPAPRPQSQPQLQPSLPNSAGSGINRPIVSQPSRPNGRISPSKNHQRLSSLTSIPEITVPRTRTQAKFTIDAFGRARVETTVVVEDEAPPPSARKRYSSHLASHPQRWPSSEDDDSSSSDDEPIIIPSRNTSFALPDPRKPTSMHPFHNSQRSISEHSTTSYRTLRGISQDNGDDSDVETVINDMTPTGKQSGDALSELRKVRESRYRQASASKTKLFGAINNGTSGVFAGNYSGHHHESPTRMTEASLPTPTSSDPSSRAVRCVCGRREVDRDDFLVHWYAVHPFPKCRRILHFRVHESQC